MKRVILVLSLIVCVVQCANILCVFNIASYSHQIVYQPIWRELSLRGHNVTVITPNPLNDPTLTNLTEIDVGPPLYKRVKRLNKNFSSKPNHWILNTLFLFSYVNSADLLFSNSEVSALINDTSAKFDAVIAEYGICTGCAFAAKFNCPLIGVLSTSLTSFMYEQTGTPNHPILYPEALAPYGTDSDFFERIAAVAHYLYIRMFYHYVAVPRYDALMRKHFGNSIPYYGDIERNVSLVLVNNNLFLQGPRPLGPNVIPIDRLHINKTAAVLPKELQHYLDEAVEGVIYFSLGSNVKSALLDEKKQQEIVNTFAELPFKILWKFEVEDTIKIPQNVKMQKWFPQQAVLAHPNVKLFITQGGLQSAEEATVYKVPLLVIPFIFDQDYNAKRIAKLGIGRILDFKDLNTNNLKSSILEVLTNPSYRQAISDLSDSMTDTPISNLQKAIFWIEYIIRHKGAKYFTDELKYAPWYKFLLLDVMCFMGLLCVFLLYSSYRSGLLLINLLRSYNGNKLKTN